MCLFKSKCLVFMSNVKNFLVFNSISKKRAYFTDNVK